MKDTSTRDLLRAAATRQAHACPRCGGTLRPVRPGWPHRDDEWPTLGYRDCPACGYKAVTAGPKETQRNILTLG